MFSSSVAERIARQIRRARLRPEPFAHFYATEVFPADFYAALLDRLPPDEDYSASAYGSRAMCFGNTLDGPLWGPLSNWLTGNFSAVLREKFNDQFKARFSGKVELLPQIRLVRDTDGYAIKPHTDHPGKVLSLLFYLPKDTELQNYGTAIYKPNDPEFRCEGRSRWAFENFTEVWRAPFRPNSCLGFFKTDQAFHGVPKINRPGIVRNMLLVNVYDMAFAGEMKMVA